MNVIITVGSTVSVPLALGVTAGQYRFSLNVGGFPLYHQDTDSATATFADVLPGDYTASVGRLSSDGVTFLADPISAPITVPALTPETVDVPASISVSLA